MGGWCWWGVVVVFCRVVLLCWFYSGLFVVVVCFVWWWGGGVGLVDMESLLIVVFVLWVRMGLLVFVSFFLCVVDV